MKLKYFNLLFIFIFFIGCAGWGRGCSSWCAKNYGADWVVVELTEMKGTPYRCWELKDFSISNEEQSDGIYWKDRETGNLIHISGSYDYVQVLDNNWDAAFKTVNMTSESCKKVRERIYDPDGDRYITK